MNGSRGHDVQWNKLITKRQRVSDCTHTRPARGVPFTDTERRVVARGWGTERGINVSPGQSIEVTGWTVPEVACGREAGRQGGRPHWGRKCQSQTFQLWREVEGAGFGVKEPCEQLSSLECQGTGWRSSISIILALNKITSQSLLLFVFFLKFLFLIVVKYA